MNTKKKILFSVGLLLLSFTIITIVSMFIYIPNLSSILIYLSYFLVYLFLYNLIQKSFMSENDEICCGETEKYIVAVLFTSFPVGISYFIIFTISSRSGVFFAFSQIIILAVFIKAFKYKLNQLNNVINLQRERRNDVLS